MKTYYTITTEKDAIAVLQSGNWQLWARLADRQDWMLYSITAVRTVDGVLQINAGEYDGIKRVYLNDEWITPVFLYMKHQCEDCHYPPSMCCLQPSLFEPSLQEYWDSELAGEVMDSDDYIAEEEAINAMPNVKIVLIEA